MIGTHTGLGFDIAEVVVGHCLRVIADLRGLKTVHIVVCKVFGEAFIAALVAAVFEIAELVPLVIEVLDVGREYLVAVDLLEHAGGVVVGLVAGNATALLALDNLAAGVHAENALIDGFWAAVLMTHVGHRLGIAVGVIVGLQPAVLVLLLAAAGIKLLPGPAEMVKRLALGKHASPRHICQRFHHAAKPIVGRRLAVGAVARRERYRRQLIKGKRPLLILAGSKRPLLIHVYNSVPSTVSYWLF